METVEINTYDNVFEVSKQWLLANTEADSVEEFLDTYTWDEGEWLYFLYQKDEREFEIGILTDQIKQGYRLFKNNGHTQEGLLHDSSKKTCYQFSYFDSHGAVGDLEADTLEKMAVKIYNLGFQVCSVGHHKILK
ncbi:MAG TPA: hypothetical protein VK108_08190 [Pseudogracilibacillus sp.]|nr:hypothetical protein [Pseudogracilibacillus sp.]